MKNIIKNSYKLIIIYIFSLITIGCTVPIKDGVTYSILVNESLPLESNTTSENVDFKLYFTITDSNGKRITTLDNMLDTSKVDFTIPGSFEVTISYKNISEKILITVVEKEVEEPTEEEPTEEEPTEKEPTDMVNASDLFFSEYVEGSGSNKYIEIFNGTGKTVDLSIYSILLYTNGQTTPQFTFYLNGILKDGKTFVIYNTSSITKIKEFGDISHSICNYNGNDVIELYKEGELIDVIGDLLNPVASGWDIGDIKEATKDHTLIRKPEISNPNSLWTPSEWLVCPLDDFSNIKEHLMANYEPTVDDDDVIEEPPLNDRIPDLYISEYFEGGVGFENSKYIELYNGLNTEINLDAYELALYNNGSKTPTTTQKLSGTLLQGSTYIVYAPYSRSEIKDKGHLSSEVCYFNGKSAIALLKNGQVIDIIGVIGEYPDKGWIVEVGYTTVNNTLIRKEHVNSPRNIWDNSEWYICYENYLYGLGNHFTEYELEPVINDFSTVFTLIKNLTLDGYGSSSSIDKITVKGTVFMDVKSETSLVYLTDGKYIIKLHGTKIHNYTAPGTVYEVDCYYGANIYQPSLKVENPASDIRALHQEEPVTTIEVKQVSLSDIIQLKRDNFVKNIENGFLGSMLKITGYVHLDTHNSTRYDYALTVTENYTKNDTGYINNALYFKNDYQDCENFLYEYEVIKGASDNVEVTIYGVLYEWNTNRKNWMLYLSEGLTFKN